MTETQTSSSRSRRERPKVLRLTEAAAARIHEILDKSDGRYIGVRVGVKNGGCAGMSQQACLSSDWRTVGFEDGTQGRSEGNIANYQRQCAEHGVQPNLDAYREGHAQGVEVYCRAGNGFEAGHSGAVYQGVCPKNLEPEFLANYNSGRRLYEFESAVRNIDAQIASNNYEQERIRGELTSIAAAMISKDTKPEDRVLMVSRSAELGRRYGELTNATQSLTAERAVKDRELHDYQQTMSARL